MTTTKLFQILLMFAAASLSAATNAAISYTYDANNQLTQVTYADGQSVSFTYDDMGNRTALSSASTAPPTITTTSPLPTGSVNVVYSQPLAASGGQSPYMWSLASGSLPSGVTLNGAGVLGGKPTAGGTASFRVRVKGANNATAERDFILTVIDVFGPLQGTYDGWLLRGGDPTHATSGNLTVKLTKTGAFTATGILGGAKFGFKGQFDTNGNASNTVSRSGSSPLIIQMHVSDGEITGTVLDGISTIDLAAGRAVFSKTNPCPYAGLYSFVFAPFEADLTAPQGFSFGTVTVATTGLGTMTGVLADGTKIKSKLSVSKYGTFVLYAALYANKGSCIGAVIITNNTLEATVDWFKPSSSGVYYPAGFSVVAELTGSKYVASIPMLDLPDGAGNALVMFTGGNLTGVLSNTVTIAPNYAVTATGLTLKLTAKTGLFTGSFTHPGTGKATKFEGTVLQLQNGGAGYFLGSNQCGAVTIVPTE